MSSNYTELKEKISGIQEKLDACAKKLKAIKPEEKEKYENPQYRDWSGNIKDLEEFTLSLEEWLNQPLVAEAKRYLLDLKTWSESPEKISLEEIEREWKFLSDNVSVIKNIHRLIRDMEYESFKKKTSTWVLMRITEKDIEKAENWTANAHEFTTSLKEFENRKTESKLAEKVKTESVKELLGITSFNKDNKEEINRYEELIKDAENIIKNKPLEVDEDSILNTYECKNDKEIEERFKIIGTDIKNIKNLLIKIEWVNEFPDFEDYNKLWTTKQAAIKKDDLESIRKALESTESDADKWKKGRREKTESALIKIKRMSKGVKKENLKNEVIAVEGKLRDIYWNKPNVKLLFDILSYMENLKNQLQDELRKELKNEDAISLIEEPELIEDLGEKKGWDFDRFINALEVVLRNGLVEIRAVKEE